MRSEEVKGGRPCLRGFDPDERVMNRAYHKFVLLL